MRIVWVLTVLHLVGSARGLSSAVTASDMQYERITIGLYESKSACKRMRAELLHAPGFKPESAECTKTLN